MRLERLKPLLRHPESRGPWRRANPCTDTLSRALARWQLAAGEGACDEGLADLERTWTTQATLERRSGYLLVQARSH